MAGMHAPKYAWMDSYLATGADQSVAVDFKNSFVTIKH